MGTYTIYALMTDLSDLVTVFTAINMIHVSIAINIEFQYGNYAYDLLFVRPGFITLTISKHTCDL